MPNYVTGNFNHNSRFVIRSIHIRGWRFAFWHPVTNVARVQFFSSNNHLLPISLLINLFQIVKDRQSVDLNFYKKILVYTVPFIVICLIFANATKINIGMLIGALLLLVAAKDFFTRINRVVDLMVRYEKSYLILMGIVHGCTNLGGSLLTVIVHSKGYEKRITRATVAAAYATFATFQILALLVSGFDIDIKLSTIAVSLAVGLTIFIVTEKMIYAEIDAEAYRKLFAGFLFLSGGLLCVQSI